jgi:hypothetical protein
MHDAEFDSYLDLLARFLRLSPRQRTEIRRELRAHLDDALAEAAARGEPPDAALRRVLDDFGDAAELAARFRTSHKNQRWMMHATLSAACVAFALVTFNFFTPPAQQANAARGGESELVPPRSPEQSADTQVRAALAKTLPEVQFQDQPLSQVLEWIQTSMNVNVHVQWSALENAGVARDTTISFALKNVTVERLLRMIIDELETPVAYAVQDGILTISTRERMRRHLRTQVYDVRDLIAMIPASTGNERPKPGGNPVNESKADPVASEPDSRERLVELITHMVDPDTWELNGGTASVEQFNGLLVVRQFDAVHSQIRDLLDSLRTALVEKR